MGTFQIYEGHNTLHIISVLIKYRYSNESLIRTRKHKNLKLLFIYIRQKRGNFVIDEQLYKYKRKLSFCGFLLFYSVYLHQHQQLRNSTSLLLQPAHVVIPTVAMENKPFYILVEEMGDGLSNTACSGISNSLSYIKSTQIRGIV